MYDEYVPIDRVPDPKASTTGVSIGTNYVEHRVEVLYVRFNNSYKV